MSRHLRFHTFWGAILVVAGSLLAGFVTVHAETVVEIKGLNVSDLESRYFTLKQGAELEIEAVCGESARRGDLFAYPWIIDARTRELVWSMADEVTDEWEDSDWLRHYEDDLRLSAGDYELFYYVGFPNNLNFNINSDSEDLSDYMDELADWLNELKKWDKDKSSARRMARDYFVRLACDEDVITIDRHPLRRESVIRLLEPDNNAYDQRGFSLSDDVSFEVYAIGEFWESSSIMVDRGWITNARTGETVWEMTEDNTDRAGGAEKNRRFRGRVTLPKGDYFAYYITDDSHTYDDWNSPPPYDPDGWGLQLFTTRDSDKDRISDFADDPRRSEALVRLTGLGDNELRVETFQLKKPTSVRVYAIGEYDRFHDDMADYAYIKRDDDGQKVWVMVGDNTHPAGGADKNREFDGVVKLDQGEYTLYYVTDGSHSFADGWNASPPNDQRSYGISIFPVDTDFDAASFSVVDVREARLRNAVASITNVGNDRDISKHFTLNTPTRLRVHAMGEGDRNGMYDYGWIENVRSGEIVWEMTYRKTSHAGGAEKNRLVNQIILLDKGEYALHYVSDGSHSAADGWNSSPPHDADEWGITLSRVDKDGD